MDMAVLSCFTFLWRAGGIITVWLFGVDDGLIGSLGNQLIGRWMD